LHGVCQGEKFKKFESNSLLDREYDTSALLTAPSRSARSRSIHSKSLCGNRSDPLRTAGSSVVKMRPKQYRKV